MWPKKTASAAPAVASDASPQLAPSRCASHTATKPLRPSPASVNAAAALLPVRNTLDAPAMTASVASDVFIYNARSATGEAGDSSRLANRRLRNPAMNTIFVRELRVETRIGVY